MGYKMQGKKNRSSRAVLEKDTARAKEMKPNSGKPFCSSNILENLSSVKRARLAKGIVDYSRERFAVAVALPYPFRCVRSCPFVVSDVPFRGATKRKGSGPVAFVPPEAGKSCGTSSVGPTATLAGAVLQSPGEEDSTVEDMTVQDVSRRSISRSSWRSNLLRIAVAKQEKRCHIVRRTDGTEKYCGLSITKGTRAYNVKKYKTYSERVKKIQEEEAPKIFVTLSANRVDPSCSLREVWEVFYKELAAVTNRMSVDFDAHYFYGVESDGDGKPHCHAVFSLRGFHKSARTCTGNVDSLYIILRAKSWLVRRWALGTLDVQEAVPDTPGKSLAWYICKSLLCDIETISAKAKNNPQEVTEEEYRFLHSLVMSEMTRRKQFMGSRSVVSHETHDRQTNVQETTQLASLLDSISDDMRIVEEALASGTFDDKSDEAFFRLLGAYIPAQCREEWFFAPQSAKIDRMVRENGGIVRMAGSRMQQKGFDSLRCSCSMLSFFDKRFHNL